MNYQNINIEITNLNFQRKYFYSIFGLYLFSLGTTTLGYSIYLLMESLGLVEKNIITWSAQGLFWFLILLSISIFILFIPVEFLNTFKLSNSSFKDLIINIIIAIFLSLLFLLIFQFFLNPINSVTSDIVDIGKAISFSGFITIPLALFMHHNLIRTFPIKDNHSYSLVLFIWIMSSQIFL